MVIHSVGTADRLSFKDPLKWSLGYHNKISSYPCTEKLLKFKSDVGNEAQAYNGNFWIGEIWTLVWEMVKHWTSRRHYRQISNIRRTLVGNKIVGHSCSWSIASWRCSNYIFILDLTPDFIGLGKDNCKTRREAFQLGDLVRLILQTLRYNRLVHHYVGVDIHRLQM